jgi:threonine aldolase
MFFASDNGGPVHPQVMDALAAANTGYAMPYGNDEIMDDVRTRLRDIFEAPEAAVYLVATGTGANVMALATLAQPFQRIYCSPTAHIVHDECNAPEFFSGGAKLQFVGDSHKMTADALRQTMTATAEGDVHSAQRGPVSITQVTEMGGVYTLDELSSLTAVAREYGQKVHLDGARFTNALVALGCTPAEMTWKAGVDVVSFGGTKNGLMGVEAVIFFDPAHAWEFELRRKRGAHLFSKHRYLSAQMQSYLVDDLWLDMARRANASCQRLTAALRDAGATFPAEPEANLLFAHLPRATHKRLRDGGAIYYLMDETDGDPDEMIESRFVCDWSIGDNGLDAFLALLADG